MAPPRSSKIIVRPVRGRSDRKKFIDFQYDLYADSSYWIPQLRRDVKKTLDPKKNAFFEHGEIAPFLALDAEGSVVGRIAGIVNGMHLKKYDDGVGFFGFFECVDDFTTAEALLQAAATWLKERSLTSMRGPANPSLNDIAGLLTDGFDKEPSLMMPYNPPYYEDFLMRFGFERAMTMWAYYIHKKYVDAKKLRRGVDIVKRRYPSLSLRTLDMDRFDEEAEAILDIYNDAWSHNWGHVPMAEAEFAQLIDDMRQIVDPNIIFVVEDEGTPVAFSISLPNLNQALRYVKDGRLFPLGLPKLLAYAHSGAIYECRTLLMGVRRAYQGRGLDALLNLAIIENGPHHGYDASEMSWILDTNARLKNAITSFGGVRDKEYALFEMSL